MPSLARNQAHTGLSLFGGYPFVVVRKGNQEETPPSFFWGGRSKKDRLTARIMLLSLHQLVV